jgi:hypothetical protein
MRNHRCAARRKLREWAGRYLPAELLGATGALGAAGVAHAGSGSLASAAVAATVGESLGYYGCMAVREAVRHHAGHRQHATTRRLCLTGARTVQGLVLEFGPAELVDSVLARPFLTYAMLGLLGNLTAGVVAGKLAADLVFYCLAIAAYECRQRHLPLPAAAPPAAKTQRDVIG